jgi:hypothetical protein
VIARHFDPDTGRFIQRDPAMYVDGMNVYNGYFVPRGMDPTGKTPGKYRKFQKSEHALVCCFLKMKAADYFWCEIAFKACEIHCGMLYSVAGETLNQLVCEQTCLYAWGRCSLDRKCNFKAIWFEVE